jgi:hypothetical protein
MLEDNVGSPPDLAGRLLEPRVRDDMGAAFHHDFSNVRVHTDAQASDDAAARGALAYTTGTDIVFANRHYAPEREDGRHLLAHELAHVVQQSSLPDAGAIPARAIPSADATEREAQHAARAVIDGRLPDVPTRLTGGPVIQRQPAPAPPARPAPAARAPTPPASMSIANVSGPTADTCGAFSWKVNFTLPTASPAGGHFVQEITVRRTGKTCAGQGAGCDLNFHYWEAWHVAANGTQDELVAAGTFDFADQYSLSTCGAGTKGTFSFTGSVRFYEGLALPASFIAQNPNTIAGDLPSTANNPNLRGGTPARTHSISGSWDCCPAAPAPAPARRPSPGPAPAPAPAPAPERATTITSHTP